MPLFPIDQMPDRLMPDRLMPDRLDAIFDFKHLLAAIHTGFQVDMMRAVQFASCFIFDIGVTAQRIMGAAHIPL
ncbi:pyruvate phosphate dikinase [Candidatus Puniceispirillum marinum IMCC1322]|uniref:Pyruvate phosphate dikinase n=1 Tax=Puniceispirillum marinum (strain IMCC1322) TaxID=488538 RepID=D5BNI7_PUNMI|nr:pyruvate phosphate dikinase [Candidatus Puniceispirillum marinum IMCC1322]